MFSYAKALEEFNRKSFFLARNGCGDVISKITEKCKRRRRWVQMSPHHLFKMLEMPRPRPVVSFQVQHLSLQFHRLIVICMCSARVASVLYHFIAISSNGLCSMRLAVLILHKRNKSDATKNAYLGRSRLMTPVQN